MAFTCATTACAGRGSILKSSWPFLTSWPSLTGLSSSCPSTSDLTATLLIASTLPTAVTMSRTDFHSTLAVLTGAGGATVGAGAFEQEAKATSRINGNQRSDQARGENC